MLLLQGEDLLQTHGGLGICPHLPLVGARDPRLAGGELPDPSESPMTPRLSHLVVGLQGWENTVLLHQGPLTTEELLANKFTVGRVEGG